MPAIVSPTQPNPGIILSANDLVKQALRLLGVVGSGENPTAGEASDGLIALNQLLESWNTDRLNIFTITAAIYQLQDGKAQYTIGGPGLAADFDAPRPLFINNANIIITIQTPNVRIPLYLLNDDEWADIRVRQITSTIPQQMYNDGSFPLSTLNFWGIPSGAMQLELFTWTPLSLFPDPTTALAFPPGYARALKYNLAVELAPEYGSAAVQMAPVAQANSSRAAIASMNVPTPLMECDPAVMPTLWTARKRFFNIFTG